MRLLRINGRLEILARLIKNEAIIISNINDGWVKIPYLHCINFLPVVGAVGAAPVNRDAVAVTAPVPPTKL